MKTKIDKSLSVILPVYNEGFLLEEAVDRLLTSLSENFMDYELIIVDDGNNDENQEIIERLRANHEDIKIIRNIINLNLGISIQRGFASAEKDLLVFNSADLPLSPDDLRYFAEKIGMADMLVLERKIYAGATLWRRFASRINLLILKILFPFASKGMKDLNYTFLFKRTILKDILPLAKSPVFTQPEMILRAVYKKYKVRSTPADYHARKQGKGAFGKPHDILWSLYDMLRFRIIKWLVK
ncbi:MAG: glycosyltransferase family 2 protein [Candidatus Omnitrophica bacterium]|nr:glycosyltransferase family 2 protein [Candidatus Omnitrophota bacterium]